MLSELLWFTVTMHFCLRGRETQSQLCVEDFEITSTSEGEYVKTCTSHTE